MRSRTEAVAGKNEGDGIVFNAAALVLKPESRRAGLSSSAHFGV
jgi:hypothetical protein